MGFPICILSLAAGVYLLIQVKHYGFGNLYKGLSWLVILLSVVCLSFCATRGVMHMRHKCDGAGMSCHGDMGGHGGHHMMGGHSGMSGGCEGPGMPSCSGGGCPHMAAPTAPVAAPDSAAHK